MTFGCIDGRYSKGMMCDVGSRTASHLVYEERDAQNQRTGTPWENIGALQPNIFGQ